MCILRSLRYFYIDCCWNFTEPISKLRPNLLTPSEWNVRARESLSLPQPLNLFRCGTNNNCCSSTWNWLRLLWCEENSATRFGEIPPLWQICKIIWQYIWGLFGLRRSFKLTLAQFVCFWANFIAENGQILKTQSGHLVILEENNDVC